MVDARRARAITRAAASEFEEISLCGWFTAVCSRRLAGEDEGGCADNGLGHARAKRESLSKSVPAMELPRMAFALRR
jgi:hypothetical protein